MSEKADIIKAAITSKVARHRSDLRFHAALCFVALCLGASLFYTLWVYFPTITNSLIGEISGWASSLISLGVGTFFTGRILTLRDRINSGLEWLSLYEDAAGPPPHKILGDVRDRVLNWLEAA